MTKHNNWWIPVFITFLLLGVLITIQFRSQQNYLRDLPQQKEEDLILTLNKINDKKSELEKELADLDKQLQLINTNVSEEETITNQLYKDIERQKLALGTIPVQGPGITITIERPPLIYLDVIDIINELWNSRAEAIAVNNRRITSWSKIYWSETSESLTVDGVAITFPCTIQAIGDAEKLDSGLHLLGGVLDNLAYYDIHPIVEIEEQIVLPAATQPNIIHMKQKIEKQ